MKNNERGLISEIVLVIFGLVALKYFFDFSIFEFLGTEEGKSLLDYLKEILVFIKNGAIQIWSYIK